MDQRQSAQHPFSRPQQLPLSRDVRYAPIPPPPYSSQQLPARPDLPHQTDPFLHPRNDMDRTRTPPLADQIRLYRQPMTSLYPPNPFTAAHSHVLDYGHNHRRQASKGSGAEYGNGGTDRYSAYGSEAPASASTDETRDVISSRHQHQHQHQPLPPPPHHPAPMYAPSQQIAYPQDDPRRHSLSGASPPRTYGATLDHLPPPPPPFSGRQMLPPSSPHQYQPQHNVQQAITRGPPPPPPFSGSRDLPALPAINRPGSSMSILSMLGSDTDRAPRDPSASAHTNGSSSMIAVSAPSPASRSMPAPSPPHHSLEMGSLFRRAHTPDAYSILQPQGPRSTRAFSGGPPHRPYSAVQAASPEARKCGPPLRVQQPNDQYSPTSESGFPQEHQKAHVRRSSIDRMVSRPTSQPSGYRTPPLDYEDRMSQHSARPEALEYRHGPSRFQGDIHSALREGREFESERANRDLNGSQDPYTQRTIPPVVDSAPRTSDHCSSVQARGNGVQESSYPFLTRSIANTAPPHQHRPDADPPASRAVFPTPRNRLNASQSSMSPELSRRSHDARSLGDGPSNPELTQPSSQNQSRLFSPSGEKQATYTPRMSYLAALNEDNLHPFHRAEPRPKGVDDPQQQQRSSLSLAIENSKRTGRISPMPQAVQGAQGQMNGPASTPGIKNEFARMFSGIGSGAGSAISGGSGTPTPLPPSPPKRDDGGGRTPFGPRNDLSELKMPRVVSKGGKRSRKIKDDDAKIDSESGDGRGTPSASVRGAKRSKHYHHPAHLHHRHHHKPEDEENVPAAPPSTSLAALANGKRTVTPSQIQPAPPAHHHHHHHHHRHHHHHHNPKGNNTVSVPPPRKPTTTVISQQLLDSVAQNPRRHLGSTLYSPQVRLPSSRASHETLKFGFVTTPKPLPRFEGRENCTFTVRVPRFYLSSVEREQICLRRALWGTDVYTDDSDPVAAAIHAGWIRGEWADGVDLSMLDLGRGEETSGPGKTSEVELQSSLILTQAPAKAATPPGGMDLHITLLVLPALQSYASSVAHGLRSRGWGKTHDGMSFQIQQIAWVSEGINSAEERGGQARRTRLKAMMDTARMISGPPLRLDLMRQGMGPLRATAVAA